MEYILSLDQGTTGTRAILFNSETDIICSCYKEHTQIYPRPGWVEHNPIEILENTKEVCGKVIEEAQIKGILLSDIKAMGIANQGETVMLWDRDTGRPVYNAIVWQCRRTSQMIDALKAAPGIEEMIKNKTGLIPDAYFSAAKIKWIIDHVPDVKQGIKQGKIAAGTLDTWLIWNLTGRASFVTDCATASRTMLMNIHTLGWDDDLLALFDIDRKMLPDILPNNAFFGSTSKEEFMGLEVGITGSIVDQQGALFGQGCFEAGAIKNTYGTGCFMLMNTGRKPIQSKSGLLTSVAWTIDGQTSYVLDGGIYIAGAALQWLRDKMQFIQVYDEVDAAAQSLKDNGGVYFVPAFSGLAAPYWDQDARGAIIGMTASTSRTHIIRATLESIAYQVKNILDCFEEDYGKKITSLKVDGGVTKSEFLMQFQADILGIPVEVPVVTETTALGVAFLAGLKTGVWKDLKEIRDTIRRRKTYRPGMQEDVRRRLLADWQEAVKRSMHWAHRA